LRLTMNRRTALAALCGTAAFGPAARAATHVFAGFPGTEVRFTSVEAGQALLGAQDEWMVATSDFQRRAVMGGSGPVTLDASASGTRPPFGRGATRNATAGCGR
jgi:hypothetical protein